MSQDTGDNNLGNSARPEQENPAQVPIAVQGQVFLWHELPDSLIPAQREQQIQLLELFQQFAQNQGQAALPAPIARLQKQQQALQVLENLFQIHAAAQQPRADANGEQGPQPIGGGGGGVWRVVARAAEQQVTIQQVQPVENQRVSADNASGKANAEPSKGQ